MAGLTQQIRSLEGYRGEALEPKGFSSFWLARLRNAEAALSDVVVEDGPYQTPVADYKRYSFGLSDGGTAHARYVCPKVSERVGERVPTIVMFHDVTCGPRGWFHLTRFAAVGCAVLQLETRLWSGDICAGWDQGVSRLQMTRLIEDALSAVVLASRLERTDLSHLVTWGEGLGAALAIDVAAVLNMRRDCEQPHGAATRGYNGIAEVAALNPMPADLRQTWESSACELVYQGLRTHFRVSDPRGERADELFSTLEYVDTANFANHLRADLLLGTSMLDAAAIPASQFAIVSRVQGRARHLTYPKWEHGRVNDFEDAFLESLHF